MKKELRFALALLSAAAPATAQAEAKEPVSCHISVANFDKDSFAPINSVKLDFTLPALESLTGSPVTLLRSVEQNIEVRYGIASSTDFSTQKYPEVAATPVQYLQVARPAAFAVGERPETIFVVDPEVTDFYFNSYLDVAKPRPRAVHLSCGEMHEPVREDRALTLERGKAMGCEFSSVDAEDHPLVTTEGTPRLGGEHDLLTRVQHGYYGFATVDGGGSFSTEMANVLYMPCVMSSFYAPQGVKFVRHISDLTPVPDAFPVLPIMRLSAQCQTFETGPPVVLESKPPQWNVTFTGAYSEAFSFDRKVGRKATRIQASVFLWDVTVAEDVRIKLTLPSGKVVEDTPFWYLDKADAKHVLAADIEDADVDGPIELDVQVCEVSIAGASEGECRELTTLRMASIEGPTVFYR